MEALGIEGALRLVGEAARTIEAARSFRSRIQACEEGVQR
jgi:hypothetical protein